MMGLMELMELGQGPMFTFPLTEEVQDERAALRAQTQTIYIHVHTHGQVVWICN